MTTWRKRIAVGAAVASLLGTLVWFTLSRRPFPIADEFEPDGDA